MRNKHKSLVLAQCDAQITNEMIAQNGRQVIAMVEKFSTEHYLKLVEEQPLYAKYDSLLRVCYNEATNSSFEFKLDSFGGYGLFFNGTDTLKVSKRKVLENSWAILEQVDSTDENKILPISVFKPTKVCNKMRLMCGSVRFVNHSCDPNCQFVVCEVGAQKCVKVEILKDIHPGEELLVYYGDDYFGENNIYCKCRNDHLHVQQAAEATQATDVDDKLELRVFDPVESNRLSVYRQNRRRLVVSRKRPRVEEARSYQTSSSDNSSDWSSDKESENEQNELMEVVQSQVLNEVENVTESNNFNISTPQDSVAPDLEIENVSEIDSNVFSRPAIGLSSSESEDDCSQAKCNPESDLVSCVSAIISRHGTSDSEAKDWISLLRLVGTESTIPSFKSMKRKYQPTAQEKMERLKACGSGFRWSLDFMMELQSVIEKNITEIFRYDNDRKKESELNLPAFFDLNAKTLEIFIILNSDGVKIMKASSKSIWPVWLAIANLPPILRSSFENIVLAALWLGNNKPAWDDIFEVMF